MLICFVCPCVWAFSSRTSILRRWHQYPHALLSPALHFAKGNGITLSSRANITSVLFLLIKAWNKPLLVWMKNYINAWKYLLYLHSLTPKLAFPQILSHPVMTGSLHTSSHPTLAHLIFRAPLNKSLLNFQFDISVCLFRTVKHIWKLLWWAKGQ